MKNNAGIGFTDKLAFAGMFSTDWLLGANKVEKLMPRRWEKLYDRMLQRVTDQEEGKVYAVERRRDLTPEEFRERYFRTGIPVVLEGAAANWPATKKWTPEYLAQFCGDDEVAVLDGRNWTVNRAEATEAVSTSEHVMKIRELMSTVKNGGAWYGAFLELLDKYADLRSDLDLSFVARFGHTRPAIPWQRNVLAKMYVGGAGTATSYHCAGVSNLYVQFYGQKKWVLIAPWFSPFMYPASCKGINWQSRVDFRNPDLQQCPLYRYVDRHETVLGPGDVLWNPPFVWHGVANVTESIAVSLWWINVTRGFSNNFLFSALTLGGRPNPIALQLGWGGAQGNGASRFAVHLNR